MLETFKKQKPMTEDAASGDEDHTESSTVKLGKKDLSSTTFNRSSGVLHGHNDAILGRNKVRIIPELAVFNYFHERQQEGALKLLFNEEKREDYGRKVESMGIWMPPVRRIYAHYRFNELKKVNRETAQIWKDKHVLPVASLNSQQYYALKKVEKQFKKQAETFRDKYFPPEAFIGFNDPKVGNLNESQLFKYKQMKLDFAAIMRKENPMVCATTPSGSGHSAEAEALVYNFVKRKKPGLLLEMFGEDRCQELEKRDHLYDRNSLLSMLEAVKGRLSVAKEAASGDVMEKKKITIIKAKKDFLRDNNAAIPGRNKVRITPELAVFNYFHERQQEGALKLLFNKKTREDYGRKVDTMGIWMPPVRRIYAHYRFNELKKENRETREIWKCELCKKEHKSNGYGSDLLVHIGIHENIPCPCFIEGCDATLRSPVSLGTHLLRKHVIHVSSLNSQQYYILKEVRKQFLKQAETFRDKYFPPEAFIGLNDRKTRCMARDLEDPICRECGKTVLNVSTRRTHVANHLKLSYKCVFEGCDYKTDAAYLARHYTAKHSTKVGDLNEEQLAKHRQIREDHVNRLKKILPHYFPYKSEE
uniref:C2H2-type domain-containing protein n=1 Tax=Steinernema glaseri TaxID=37863 RepID=A0A1I7ZJF0_9BILA